MNRLQKKCLIATAGFHLLLLVILFVGPGFFTAKPKPDDTQVLDVIPANLIDAAFSSGVKNAQAPPPAPPQVKPIVTPPPTPEPPKPAVTPPTFVEKVEKLFTPPPVKLPPDDLTPVVKPSTKPPEHIIKPDLTHVTHVVPKNSHLTETADNARQAAKEAKEKAAAFARAMRTIKDNSSKSTIVDMPGERDSAYAPYKDAIGSIYYNAWTPPDDVANDDSNTKVSITIARDGTVISSHIITPSGDSRMDASVQRALDRVSSVPPLPAGTKENQKIILMNFNLKAKRMIG